MKQLTKVLLIAAVLCAALSLSAFAGYFTHAADELAAMDLFNGTENGYELDRAPTRAEAAAMLVRLLGKEAEAMELTYTAPFTDVADWAKPYVQYLYDNNLSNGVSETMFGSAQVCTAQQYTTFLMRALGYSEAAGDFTYAEALAFGMEMGVVDYANYNTESFLRDNVVAMSYTALSVNPKGSDVDLLAKLSAEGSVVESQKTRTLFDNYDSYIAMSQALGKEQNVAMGVGIDMEMSTSGIVMTTVSGTMDMAMMMNPDMMDSSKMMVNSDLVIEMNEAMVGEGQPTTMPMKAMYYYTDGVYYMDIEGQKVKMPMSFDDTMSQMGTMGLTQNMGDPLSAITDLQVSTEGDVTTYTVTLAANVFNQVAMMGANLAGSSMDTGEGTDIEVSVGAVTMSVSVQDDMVKAITADMQMEMVMLGVSIMTDLQMDATVTATGDAVVVTLPDDLDTYMDMDELMATVPTV